MPIEPETQTILGGAGVTGAVLWLLQAIWRRFRRERVEDSKDRAEINVMASLERRIRAAEERADKSEQRADEAFRELRAAMQEIGSLRAQVAELQRQLGTRA